MPAAERRVELNRSKRTGQRQLRGQREPNLALLHEKGLLTNQETPPLPPSLLTALLDPTDS